jgi:hypothetical protein
MKQLFLEALDAPQPGWPGRRRFIALQLVRMAVEGAVFVLVLAALLGCVLLVAAATDTLPR